MVAIRMNEDQMEMNNENVLYQNVEEDSANSGNKNEWRPDGNE